MSPRFSSMLRRKCSFNGWRLTMVDSLDTMLVMGLHGEFQNTIPILANMTFELSEVSAVSDACPSISDSSSRTPMLRSLRQSSDTWVGYSPHMPFLQSRYCLAERMTSVQCSSLRSRHPLVCLCMRSTPFRAYPFSTYATELPNIPPQWPYQDGVDGF